MKKANLNDLYNELWLRKRNNGEIKWITKDGSPISIKDMDDEHLINSIKKLERFEELNNKLAQQQEDYFDALSGDWEG